MVKNGLERLLNSATGKFGFKKYEKYDVILFGESHVSEDDLNKQVKIVEELAPKYALFEGLNDMPLTRLSKLYKDLNYFINLFNDKDEKENAVAILMNVYKEEKESLKDLKTLLKEVTLNDLHYTELGNLSKDEKYNLYLRQKKKDYLVNLDKFMKKYNDFNDTLNIPIYMFPTEYLSKLKEKFRELYSCNSSAQKAVSRLTLLIQFIEDSRFQLEINHATDKDIIRSVAYTKNKEAFTAGIDLSSEIKLNASNYERELRMGQKIVEYGKIAKDQGEKAFVSVGKYHLREDSAIYDYLNSSGLSYKVINKKSNYSYYDALMYDIYMSEPEDKK